MSSTHKLKLNLNNPPKLLIIFPDSIVVVVKYFEVAVVKKDCSVIQVIFDFIFTSHVVDKIKYFKIN